MTREVSEVPRGRRADSCNLGADIDENADIELGTADTGWLGDAEESGGVQFALSFVRQSAQAFAFRGAFGDLRREAAGALDHFIVADLGERNPCFGQGC